MIKCDLTDIEEIIERCGRDWSNIEFENIDMTRTMAYEMVDLRGVTFPKDKHFFTENCNRELNGIYLPEADYSGYDFYEVCLTGVTFTENSILPRTFFRDIVDTDWGDLLLPKMDYSEFEFEDVSICNCEFPLGSVLPSNSNFFQELKDEDVLNTSLPEADYSNYNFSNVNFSFSGFGLNSVLPKDFFQQILDKSAYSMILPQMDYSSFDFTDVNLNYAVFPENSILPKGKDFFQGLYDKNISGTRFPTANYSSYNFKGIRMRGAIFTEQSILPKHKDFLKDVFNDMSYGGIMGVVILGTKDFKLTDNVIKNIHHYNLDGVSLDLNDYTDKLTKSQLGIIRTKYKGQVGKDIILPPDELVINKEKTYSIADGLSI